MKLSKIILPSFHDFYSEFKKGVKTFYVAKGGRNSSKSTTISIIIILTLIQFPVNVLAVRKVANTLEKSMFEQLKRATILLGVEDDFIFRKSPLSIVYKHRGNEIIFRGADDPLKIKSIVTAQFPITTIWIEELAEFKTEDEIQIILDSILRAKLPEGLRYKFLYSYNPPKRKQSWVNKKFETSILSDNIYVHHSSYLDNHYLSEQTIQEINILKETNIKKYNWVYLGMPTGGGVVPFENLEFRTIKDDEIKSFNNIREGIDWGYAVDPFAFVQWHYDKKKNTIYALNEIYKVQAKNRNLIMEVEKLSLNNIIADSSEPKSIDEFRENNIRILPAKKGAGSVEYGEKWLNDLEAIIIDPVRTPHIAQEFESIDYQIDRFGELIARLEDKDNHTIDATRYAFERDMQQPTFRF